MRRLKQKTVKSSLNSLTNLFWKSCDAEPISGIRNFNNKPCVIHIASRTHSHPPGCLVSLDITIRKFVLNIISCDAEPILVCFFRYYYFNRNVSCWIYFVCACVMSILNITCSIYRIFNNILGEFIGFKRYHCITLSGRTLAQFEELLTYFAVKKIFLYSVYL